MASDTAQSLPRVATAGSETQTLLAVSAAHLVSHFYIMVLPVLLPLLKERLNVSFLDLGLALTTFNVVTGLTQAPTGFLVDRIGARPVLIAGLILGGIAFFSLAFVTSYPWLLVAAVAGRPRQLRLSPRRLCDPRRQHRRVGGVGRAFSIHTFAGFLGGAVAPAILLALAAFGGHRGGARVRRAASAWRSRSLVFLLPRPAAVDRSQPVPAAPLPAESAAGIAGVLTPACWP